MSFSENLERLDGMRRRLESEPLPLEEALAVFEEAVALVRESEALLREAEQKVTVLAGEGNAIFEDRDETLEDDAPGEEEPERELTLF